MNPKISILVPVYNVEPYLQRCIDSVLAQDFQDWEMILVDDGSPDRCPEICDEAARKDKRITVVHKENGGLPSARLAGFEQAKGEYLVFLDSDDWLLEGALTMLYREISRGDYDIVRSQVIREDENGTRWKEDYILLRQHFDNEDGYPLYFIKESAPYLHSAIYRSRLFSPESFLPLIRNKISLGEDWITNFLISKKVKSISYIDEPTYIYYLNNASLITSYIRAWKYNERVGECISGCLSEMPNSVKLFLKNHSTLARLQYFFFPEIPFNWMEYKKLKKDVPKALQFFEGNIPVPNYYYRFVGNNFLYYLHTRIYSFVIFVLKQKFNKRKEIK